MVSGLWLRSKANRWLSTDSRVPKAEQRGEKVFDIPLRAFPWIATPAHARRSDSGTECGGRKSRNALGMAVCSQSCALPLRLRQAESLASPCPDTDPPGEPRTTPERSVLTRVLVPVVRFRRATPGQRFLPLRLMATDLSRILADVWIALPAGPPLSPPAHVLTLFSARPCQQRFGHRRRFERL